MNEIKKSVLLHLDKQLLGVLLGFGFPREAEAVPLVEPDRADVFLKCPETPPARGDCGLEQEGADPLSLETRFDEEAADLLPLARDEALHRAVVIHERVPGKALYAEQPLDVRNGELVKIERVVAEDRVEMEAVAEDEDLGGAEGVFPAGRTDRIHRSSPLRIA